MYNLQSVTFDILYPNIKNRYMVFDNSLEYLLDYYLSFNLMYILCIYFYVPLEQQKL